MASGRRNDAVGAPLVAPGLHPEHEGHPANGAGRDQGPADARTVAEAFGSGFPVFPRRQQPVEHAVLVRVRHHLGRARQHCHCLAIPRRVAAGGDHPRLRIQARHPAQGLAGAVVGGGGHRAGVDHHQIRLVDRARRGTPRAQPHFELQRIGLVHAAPEGGDGVAQGCMSYRRQETGDRRQDGLGGFAVIQTPAPLPRHSRDTSSLQRQAVAVDGSSDGRRLSGPGRRQLPHDLAVTAESARRPAWHTRR